MSIADRIIPYVGRRFRNARADLFFDLLAPPLNASVVDIGGSTGSFAALIAARRPDLRITVADTQSTRFVARDRYGFREAALDPDGPLPFADGEFDIVLCNSVIERVTLPKERCLDEVFPEAQWQSAAFSRQRAFADEIARVGRRYFVQTPHRSFPVDAHLWLPLTGGLSHDAARRLVRITDRWWVKKCGVADWHLLDQRDMAELFPDAVITVERFGGIPKSVIAWR